MEENIKELKRLIAIPLEEYKELLIIKGKYEELSKKNTPHYNMKIKYI